MTFASVAFGAVFFSLTWVTAPAVPTNAAAEQSFAVVSELSGTASTAAGPGMKSSALVIYDWIPAGAEIQVGPNSVMTVVLASGRRFALGALARATVAPKGLTWNGDAGRELSPLPPMPHLPPLSSKNRPVGTAGAVRVRGERITGLHPASGDRSLADQAALLFQPVQGASKYRVEVADAGGQVVFTTETSVTEVTVPAGLLKPAGTYYWRVETLDRFGAAARGEAQFSTADTGTERSRAAMADMLTASSDARALGLLAEIDRRIGLPLMARDGLRAAVARAPEDTVLRAALDRVEQQLRGNAR